MESSSDHHHHGKRELHKLRQEVAAREDRDERGRFAGLKHTSESAPQSSSLDASNEAHQHHIGKRALHDLRKTIAAKEERDELGRFAGYKHGQEATNTSSSSQARDADSSRSGTSFSSSDAERRARMSAAELHRLRHDVAAREKRDERGRFAGYSE